MLRGVVPPPIEPKSSHCLANNRDRSRLGMRLSSARWNGEPGTQGTNSKANYAGPIFRPPTRSEEFSCCRRVREPPHASCEVTHEGAHSRISNKSAPESVAMVTGSETGAYMDRGISVFV